MKYNLKDTNILLYGIFMMFGSMLYAFYNSFGMYFLTHITRTYLHFKPIYFQRATKNQNGLYFVHNCNYFLNVRIRHQSNVTILSDLCRGIMMHTL